MRSLPFRETTERRPTADAPRLRMELRLDDGDHPYHWYLEVRGAVVARVYNVRDEDGVRTVCGASNPTHRVFVTPDGTNYTYTFSRGERRDMVGRAGTLMRQLEKAMVDRQNQRDWREISAQRTVL